MERRPRMTPRLARACGLLVSMVRADLEGIGGDEGDGSYAGYTAEELEAAYIWLDITVMRERKRVGEVSQ